MTRHGTGWFQYAPVAGSRSVLSFDSDAVQGEDVARPELADVGRLGRRAMRGFVRAARVDLAPTLHRSLREHLGPLAPDVAVVEESWRSYDQVNVQAGLDAWLAEPNRTFDLLGVAGFQHGRFGLADLLNPAATPQPWDPRPGNVATVNIASGPDGQVRACVVCAIYLVSEGDRRTAVLLRGPDEDGEHGVLLQVVSAGPGTAAQVAADVRGLALAHNVFRGQVLSFGGEMFEPGSTFMKFHRRPELDRAGLVLPEGVLDTIERQVVDIGVHRDRLLASGQHLKRGLLLYGPPGTGKTHTVRYLLGRTDGVTVIELTGAALHLIAEACSVARTLAPSMVVVEDVDLIAEERHAFGGGQHPLLFQLLNEMDGLGDDADVVFLLTTNRADLLEPALAARPGRVDQAVELGLPDETARRALLHLYRGRLVLADEHLDVMAAQTEGVTASFLKELLRRAAVLAADGDDRRDGSGSVSTGPMTVSPAHLDAALEELLATRNAMTRVLLGAAPPRGHPTRDDDDDDDD